MLSCRLKYLAVILSIMTVVTLLGCSSEGAVSKKQSSLPNKMPEDFNFTFKFGTYGKNQLNTFENTFTKDLVADGTKTIELTLSQKQRQKIYDMIKEIDIMSYPEDLQGVLSKPPVIYQFEININGQIKRITWNNPLLGEPIENPKTKEEKLWGLIHKLEKMITDTEEYKILPPVNGGYL